MKQQGGKKAPPLDWSTRAAVDQRPRLEHPGKQASSPEPDHLGLDEKEEPTVKMTKSAAAEKKQGSRNGGASEEREGAGCNKHQIIPEHTGARS